MIGVDMHLRIPVPGASTWRGGRVHECSYLENSQPANQARGLESHSLLQDVEQLVLKQAPSWLWTLNTSTMLE